MGRLLLRAAGAIGAAALLGACLEQKAVQPAPAPAPAPVAGRPPIVVYWTISLEGFVDLCGCSPNMPGGWSRLAVLREREPDAIWLDAGGWSHPPENRDPTPEVTARLFREGFRKLRYLAIHVAPQDRAAWETLDPRRQTLWLAGGGLDYEAASRVLKQAGGHVKPALVMILAEVSAEEALQRLEQADGLFHLEKNIWDSIDDDPGDPFPGITGNTTFSDTSNPGSKTYAGADSKIAIENITVVGDSILADISFTDYIPRVAIVSVEDFPADQGLLATVQWTAAAAETLSIDPVTLYRIWMRDTVAAGIAITDSIYLEDGLWYGIGTRDATGETLYGMEIATPGDSGIAGAGLAHVRVSMEGVKSVWKIFSYAMTGYSVDNVPPDTVRDVLASISDSVATLIWPPAGPDIVAYEIHRSPLDTFTVDD
ncbi:hypothetical protein IIA16_04710, partial [bacterium]|nr:hypothetical protein [bacterium]